MAILINGVAVLMEYRVKFHDWSKLSDAKLRGRIGSKTKASGRSRSRSRSRNTARKGKRERERKENEKNDTRKQTH